MERVQLDVFDRFYHRAVRVHGDKIVLHEASTETEYLTVCLCVYENKFVTWVFNKTQGTSGGFNYGHYFETWACETWEDVNKVYDKAIEDFFERVKSYNHNV